MSYATLDQFKQLLGDDFYAELTDRDEGTTPDDDVGQAVLDGSHGTIHAYLAKRYAVPVVTTGDPTLAQFLLKHTLRIAEYDAWQSNAFRNSIQERVRDGYRETIRLLESIAKGTADLPGEAAVASATASGTVAKVVGECKVFGDLKGLP